MLKIDENVEWSKLPLELINCPTRKLRNLDLMDIILL